MSLERRFHHSPRILCEDEPFRVFEARDGMGRQTRLRAMLDVARLRRTAVALQVDEQIPLQAAIAHVKNTAGAALTSASGSITHTGATLGSSLFLHLNFKATSAAVNMDGGSTLTALKIQACADSPSFQGAIYVVNSVSGGDHTFNVTLTGGSSGWGAMWVSEFSGMNTCTLDVSNGNGLNNNSHGAGATGTMNSQPELALLQCQNSNSGWTANTLPTQGGTWTSIFTSGFIGASGTASSYLITSATTSISPVNTGDVSSYEHANVIVVMKPGAAPSAPTLSSPTPSGTLGTATTASVGATTDNACTLYVVVDSAANMSGITETQVLALHNNANAAPVASGTAATGIGAGTVPVTGLTGSTAYSYAVAAIGAGGNSVNVVTGTFTTHAPIPVVTGVTPNPATDGSSATVAGTTFISSQGAGHADLAATAQTITSWGDTSIAETVAIGASKYGVTVAQTVTNNNGDTSAAFNITINPPAGTSYVNIGTPDTTAANRITTTGGGDLASGDQVAWRNVIGSGSVTISSDGTFVADPGVTSFDFACNTTGSGWGTWATQDLTGGTAGVRGKLAMLGVGA